MLLVDKYRPTHLKDIINTQELQNIDKQDIPHLLFYGTLGVGKMTRINALLTEIYGSFKLSIQSRTFQTASNKQIQISVASSIHHIQVTPSDVGIYDKLVIQDLIKDLAQSKNINGMFKVVVINEAHLLSVDAQHALRRTMEVYMANLRLFLCCNGIGKIIGPLRSRCLLIRVPSPSIDQVFIINLDHYYPKSSIFIRKH